MIRRCKSQVRRARSWIPWSLRQEGSSRQSLIVQAFLIAGSREQAGGDRAKLDAIGAAVNQGAQGMGLDLRTMTLTPDGFRPAEATAD